MGVLTPNDLAGRLRAQADLTLSTDEASVDRAVTMLHAAAARIEALERHLARSRALNAEAAKVLEPFAVAFSNLPKGAQASTQLVVPIEWFDSHRFKIQTLDLRAAAALLERMTGEGKC